jgi:hypothetical protein
MRFLEIMLATMAECTSTMWEHAIFYKLPEIEREE